MTDEPGPAPITQDRSSPEEAGCLEKLCSADVSAAATVCFYWHIGCSITSRTATLPAFSLFGVPARVNLPARVTVFTRVPHGVLAGWHKITEQSLP